MQWFYYYYYYFVSVSFGNAKICVGTRSIWSIHAHKLSGHTKMEASTHSYKLMSSHPNAALFRETNSCRSLTAFWPRFSLDSRKTYQMDRNVLPFIPQTFFTSEKSKCFKYESLIKPSLLKSLSHYLPSRSPCWPTPPHIPVFFTWQPCSQARPHWSAHIHGWQIQRDCRGKQSRKPNNHAAWMLFFCVRFCCYVNVCLMCAFRSCSPAAWQRVRCGALRMSSLRRAPLSSWRRGGTGWSGRSARISSTTSQHSSWNFNSH